MFRITIVPADKLIIVDGVALHFDFPAPQNLHAIQWDGQQGHMEWEDDFNWPLPAADTTAFEDEVAPYVALWQAEKERLELESAARATEEAEAEAARLAEYNSAAARAIRLRTARDARLAATDKYLLSDYPISTEDREKIKAYRQALRDLPSLDGAPFDGGGDETPWPAIPQL